MIVQARLRMTENDDKVNGAKEEDDTEDGGENSDNKPKKPFVAADIKRIISHKASDRYLGRYVLKCELKSDDVVYIETKDFKPQSLKANIFNKYAVEASDGKFKTFATFEATLTKDPRMQGRIKMRYRIDSGDSESMTLDLNYKYKEGLTAEYIMDQVWIHARGEGSGVDWEVSSFEVYIFSLWSMRICVFFSCTNVCYNFVITSGAFLLIYTQYADAHFIQVRHCIDDSGEEFTAWVKMGKDGIYMLPKKAFFDVSAQKKGKKKNVVRRRAIVRVIVWSRGGSKAAGVKFTDPKQAQLAARHGKHKNTIPAGTRERELMGMGMDLDDTSGQDHNHNHNHNGRGGDIDDLDDGNDLDEGVGLGNGADGADLQPRSPEVRGNGEEEPQKDPAMQQEDDTKIKDAEDVEEEQEMDQDIEDNNENIGDNTESVDGASGQINNNPGSRPVSLLHGGIDSSGMAYTNTLHFPCDYASPGQPYGSQWSRNKKLENEGCFDPPSYKQIHHKGPSNGDADKEKENVGDDNHEKKNKHKKRKKKKKKDKKGKKGERKHENKNKKKDMEAESRSPSIASVRSTSNLPATSDKNRPLRRMNKMISKPNKSRSPSSSRSRAPSPSNSSTTSNTTTKPKRDRTASPSRSRSRSPTHSHGSSSDSNSSDSDQEEGNEDDDDNQGQDTQVDNDENDNEETEKETEDEDADEDESSDGEEAAKEKERERRRRKKERQRQKERERKKVHDTRGQRRRDQEKQQQQREKNYNIIDIDDDDALRKLKNKFSDCSGCSMPLLTHDCV